VISADPEAVGAPPVSTTGNPPARARRPADPISAIARASREYFLAILRHAGVARSIEQLALRDQKIARARHNTVIDGVTPPTPGYQGRPTHVD